MTTTQPVATRNAHYEHAALRRTARIVGWLFIVTYVTSIAAKIWSYPPLFDGTYLTGPGQDTRVLSGAFFELILIVANIGTATAIYSLVKQRHPNLAISFVAARVMESVFIGAGILAVLALVTLRQDYAAAGDQSAAGLAAVSDAFVAFQEWTFNLGPGVVVGVGNGMILGFLMWRTGLVPRRLAVLGLIGGPLIVMSGSAAVLGIIEPQSAVQNVATIPEFFWELGFGIYLVVKGFRTPTTSLPSTPDQPAVSR